MTKGEKMTESPERQLLRDQLNFMRLLEDYSNDAIFARRAAFNASRIDALLAQPETGEYVWMYLWERQGRLISSPPFESEALCRREAQANNPGPGFMLRIERARITKWEPADA